MERRDLSNSRKAEFAESTSSFSAPHTQLTATPPGTRTTHHGVALALNTVIRTAPSRSASAPPCCGYAVSYHRHSLVFYAAMAASQPNASASASALVAPHQNAIPLQNHNSIFLCRRHLNSNLEQIALSTIPPYSFYDD